MGILHILIIVSGISFLFYGVSYFTSPSMKAEFIRFGLAKFGTLTAVFEITGGLGLLLGLFIPFLLLISSAGLALLMLFGFITRLYIKDSIWVSLPAFLFMLLNIYIFMVTANLL
ncbi:DoxX family protein [Gillisia sp. Q332]|uniref:DoxX family protein n=1 Tax=Gillisia xinjiangensis TaxID=3384765 RepID=UPI0039199B4C